MEGLDWGWFVLFGWYNKFGVVLIFGESFMGLVRNGIWNGDDRGKEEGSLVEWAVRQVCCGCVRQRTRFQVCFDVICYCYGYVILLNKLQFRVLGILWSTQSVPLLMKFSLFWQSKSYRTLQYNFVTLYAYACEYFLRMHLLHCQEFKGITGSCKFGMNGKTLWYRTVLWALALILASYTSMCLEGVVESLCNKSAAGFESKHQVKNMKMHMVIACLSWVDCLLNW